MTGATIDRLEVLAYEIPTDGPDGHESDGTLEWESTTLVTVLTEAAGETGLGYTYASKACAVLIEGLPCDVLPISGCLRPAPVPSEGAPT